MGSPRLPPRARRCRSFGVAAPHDPRSRARHGLRFTMSRRKEGGTLGADGGWRDSYRAFFGPRYNHAAFNVSAGGDLGDHASKGAMRIVLPGDALGEDAAIRADQSDGRLVAARFDAEDQAHALPCHPGTR